MAIFGMQSRRDAPGRPWAPLCSVDPSTSTVAVAPATGRFARRDQEQSGPQYVGQPHL